MRKPLSTHLFLISFALLAMFALAMYTIDAVAEPLAPQDVQNISAYGPPNDPGAVLNSSGGSLSVININITFQNPRWKAFVGNVTGQFALSDAQNSSLYNWQLATVEGELYMSRYDGVVDWSRINCATNFNVTSEQSALGQDHDMVDRINTTFSSTTHASFYVGSTLIDPDTCFSTATNVNGAAQSSLFQEVLLSDGEHLFYTGLLENATQGFNGDVYDFQMIVPEDATLGSSSPTAYYLYVELI